MEATQIGDGVGCEIKQPHSASCDAENKTDRKKKFVGVRRISIGHKLKPLVNGAEGRN